MELDTRDLTVSTCEDRFVAHDLPHLSKGPGETASTFDGTGSGIGAGDLDGDGDVDLVLANLSGPTNILENLGEPGIWRAHELIVGRFRAVAVIDHDADDDLDIVLTTGIGPPVLFTNPGGSLSDAVFERSQFRGVRAATYAMAWGDLGGDGDLDLVTGSYNAELTILRNSPVLGSDTGVLLYERDGDELTGERLSDTAQALAMVLSDVDADGRTDIVVGNDLATADFVWVDTGDGFEQVTPFSTTTYSTMSYDAADLDGDGRNELFATDMAPLPGEAPELWREVDADMAAAPRPDDIQTPENVLSMVDADDGEWVNRGREFGIEATGWSWSGLLGDLDNDADLDVFVANGMRSDLLFEFLPEARLVEPNQAFRGVAGGFEAAPDWGLGDTAGGRGAVLADLDRDGDLDLAVNNLDAPARVFENRLCGGAGLLVQARWAGTGNPDALGAVIAVTPAGGVPQTRTVLSARGYLSSAEPVQHFGVAATEAVDIIVTWPDGEVSEVRDHPVSRFVTITRPS